MTQDRLQLVLTWHAPAALITAGTSWISIAYTDGTTLRMNGLGELAMLRAGIQDAIAAFPERFEVALPTRRGTLHVVAEHGDIYVTDATRIRPPGSWWYYLRSLCEWLGYLEEEAPDICCLTVRRGHGRIMFAPKSDEGCYVSLVLPQARHLRDCLIQAAERGLAQDLDCSGTRICDRIYLSANGVETCNLELTSDSDSIYSEDFSRAQLAILALKLDAVIG